MNIFSRHFTSREIRLLVVLLVIILGALYFYMVDQPVRNGIAESEMLLERLSAEKEKLDVKVGELAAMKKELEEVDNGTLVLREMPSYNSSKAELDFLNTTLGVAQDYYISFSKVTRDGDQIRRSFSLQYNCAGFEAARQILSELENSSIRCIVGNIAITPQSGDDIMDGGVGVSCIATFYETMHGGTVDNELPEETQSP